MRRKYRAIFLILGVVVVFGSLFLPKNIQRTPQSITTVKYYCPMHPTYITTKPGDCPICNMKLVPMRESEGLTNVAEGTEQSDNIEGRTSISVNPQKQQKIGVRFSEVRRTKLTKQISLNGIVEHDETQYYNISPRFNGWIRKLYVNFTGQNIQKGEPLLSVYSPEIYRATSEYLTAIEAYEMAKANSNHVMLKASKDILDSAIRKLGLLELPADILDEIAKNRKPIEEVVIKSPITGHVIVKNAIEGRFFESGEVLYKIGDLSKLWIRAFVYEQDYPFVKLGQKCVIYFPYIPNREYSGNVDFLYPHLNEITRQAEIRIRVNNENESLRPGMWANVKIEVDYGEVLAVPASAIMDTGLRNIVFIKKQDDHFEPREVKIGFKTDDYYQISEGLSEGEIVADGALFLIDSESQIKSAIMGMTSSHEKNKGENPSPTTHKH